MKLILITFALIAINFVDGRYFKSKQLVRTPAKDQKYDPRFRGRIVNGEPADISEFPHMVCEFF